MMERDQIVTWIRRLQAVYAENRQYLTDLDAAIGDADHGINMDRGFTRVVQELDARTPDDIGGVLKAVAMVLIKTVGGAAGPLYGTFFLRAGAACAGRANLDDAGLVVMLEAGLDGVRQRGKADVGEKTMVDALAPAVERMKQALAQQSGTAGMLNQAADAARQGMAETIPMRAKKGRASYLGQRSVGHQDPGATSACLLMEALAAVRLMADS